MSIIPLVGLFAAVFLIGCVGTSYASDNLADHVVINEIDTNPPGDDSKSVLEWVELYNPTDKPVSIGGWKIASTTVTKKTLVLPPGETIKPGQFLIFSYRSLWFTDVSEKVQLRNNMGEIVDETQVITDQKNDYQSWQRKYDGIVSDSNVWIFKTSSPGSSNGKLPGSGAESTELGVFIKSDKTNYIFDEVAIISGNVTKRVYQEKPSFIQQQLRIDVTGSGKFFRTITIYPDLDLKFKTQIKLDKVLGATAGTYRIDATYGQATFSNIFSVGDLVTTSKEKLISELSISTDKSAYLPGQTVKISASSNNVIYGQGLTYKVYNPNGMQIFSGKLFPNKSGEFNGSVFMSPSSPVYGTLDIVADYGKQQAKTSFELVRDEKNTKEITLVTDKQAYGLGESIIISGRSNKHVAALDLEVIQTGTGSVGDTTNNIFKIKDQVRLEGDSTFKYELKIPSEKSNLGDYRVTISKEFGKAITDFVIVENPETYVATPKYFIKSDKERYVPGNTVLVNGHVDIRERSSFETAPILISVMDDKGQQIKILLVGSKQLVQDKLVTKTSTYSFSATPDSVGNFKLDFKINSASFTPGVYTIQGTYNKNIFETTFVVDNGIDIKNRDVLVKLDKEVYGLGETVTLDGTLVSGQPSVKIVLTKPDGKKTDSGTNIDNSKFTWSWTLPTKDFDSADAIDSRQARPTVFGTYKVSVVTPSQTVDLFFKLSKNPLEETLAQKPVTVKSNKTQYGAGEKLIVSGVVVKRQDTVSSTYGGIQERVNVQIKTMSNNVIFESNLDYDKGGKFQTTYDLPLTLFKNGKYKIVATYQKMRSETTFEIKNNIPLGMTGKTTLNIETDRQAYLPGETVHITGSTNKILSLAKLDLLVEHKKDTKIDCGTFYCGLGNNKVDISRSYENGIYSYDYQIPKNSALGTYEVIVDTEFGTFTTSFDVVNQLPKKVTGDFKISEKHNRITESSIDVVFAEQTKDAILVAPNTLQGSMIVSRGSEKITNIMIHTDDGTCIIGQSKGCLISGSTKTDDSLYKTVTIDGLPYKVAYSGPNLILEKFSIFPEEDDDIIPDSTWHIKMQNHVSSAKLYYEIIYKQIQ